LDSKRLFLPVQERGQFQEVYLQLQFRLGAAAEVVALVPEAETK
jgi:hypothetical protein